ncbi:MAG: bifunctional demethylmenaquinone methyltransferase/2-methoxy-6-polyprenyl-1,4-benzoquinol methylase UbiE [Chlamydiae bacterium]|nr:bifunctional demethylmenaquinone methyltransferase/2-methoxy-6-polyprenyl-1,4-benzoquinol methylase UbiE [Chlamydiota bacterium]MBI3277834.1 bifunctional demethylmenaquinone methyltransferase/2-methoxy-6-polyprenyl-1,4-benzoquinol methylase UbiE [Chlamydiota bacterium]
MNQNQEIGSMFSRIAKRYNLANDLLSLGIHRRWKKKALKILQYQRGEKLLDLCCGTGDFLKVQKSGIGIDLSFQMLREAQKRISNSLVCGDGENLPLKNHSIKKIIIGFGIRNIPHVPKALSEMYRVLTPGGRMVILEFSKPRRLFFSKIYFFYLNKILPRLGGWISHDSEAYHYLAKTVGAFPDGEEFLNLMRKEKFKNIKMERLHLGIASIYSGEK